MSRLYVKFAVLILCLFALPAVLIRAQPYDDHALQATLMTSDCQMPCFMGIHPGVTPVDEAVQILVHSNWVSRIKILDDVYQKTTTPKRLVLWDWSGKQPAWIQDDEAELAATDGRVTEITIAMDVRLMDMMLILGLPAHEDIWSYPGGGSYTSIYSLTGIVLYSKYTCPVADPLDNSVRMAYFMTDDDILMFHGYYTWRNLYSICK